MRVFIAGATGVLGRRLVVRLAARGAQVVGLARSAEAEALIRSLGGTPSRAGLFDESALARAAEGADVAIHAATRIPTGAGARFRGQWRENDRIRLGGTRALATAAAAAGVPLFLQQSVAWVVKTDRTGKPFDEDVPPDPPELVRSSVEGESIARDVGARHGMRVAILRGGTFYGPDASRPMAALLRRGWLPIPGAGDAPKAPIHVDDMASAFVAAAGAGREGTWNVVDDERVTLARLLRHLSEALGAPAPRSVPLWLAGLLYGRPVLESLMAPMNTSNARIRRELGWAPSFSTYRQGIAATVAAWRREGSPT